MSTKPKTENETEIDVELVPEDPATPAGPTYSTEPVEERAPASSLYENRPVQRTLVRDLTPAEYLAERPQLRSRWANTTGETVRFRIFASPGSPIGKMDALRDHVHLGNAYRAKQLKLGREPTDAELRELCKPFTCVTTFVVVVLRPGEMCELPTQWDSAIHDAREGVVVGGLAPQLRKIGVTAPSLSKPLDPKEIEIAKQKELEREERNR